MNITTANRLVQYRKQRGMSQEQLAAELGLSRQAVSKWERAEASPDTDNLIALARLYNVSLDELLLSDTQPQPAPRSQAVTAATLGFDEPPAAPAPPNISEIFETEVRQQSHEEALESKLNKKIYTELSAALDDEPESRKLSPGAQRLVSLITIAFLVVFCFVYGLLGMIFPGMQDGYPVVCTIIYLILGFAFNQWHPGWIIYLTLPLMFTMFW